ncbi:MAG: biopolymer transporter ExbD [Thermoguttaceae bacterium]|jgi:biopolymer transport protein ExbD
MPIKINKGTVVMQIPVIPLVDTVFNLLIFFLVATKVAEAERELPMMLPDATEAQALTTKPREMIINIDGQGRYFVSSRPVTLHELDLILKAAWVDNHGRTPVVFRADKRCRWEFVVAAINACRKNKVRDYRVTTREAPVASG